MIHVYLGLTREAHQPVACCRTFDDSAEYINGEDELNFCVSTPRIPSSLSAMTALTRLHFTHSNKTQAHNVWRLDWLTVLTKLQSVTAAIRHFDVVLPSSISTLTNLTALEFCCDKISVHVEWTALKLLKRVCLSGGCLECHLDCPLHGLTTLKR